MAAVTLSPPVQGTLPFPGSLSRPARSRPRRPAVGAPSAPRAVRDLVPVVDPVVAPFVTHVPAAALEVPLAQLPAPAAVAPAPGSAVLPAAVYLRRRVVALVALAVVAALAWLALSAAWLAVAPARPSPSGPAAAPVPASGATVHLVEPGDTLWSIAGDLHPSGDPRPVVDELVARNGGSAHLEVGQALDVTGL